MWSNVTEQIIDGTSGLAPNSSPLALVVGTSSKGNAKAITLGKKSSVKDSFGYGELPNRLTAMQNTMDDVSILAMKTEGDISGKVELLANSGLNDIQTIGHPTINAAISLKVLKEGSLDTAEILLSMSGDKNIQQKLTLPSDGVLILEDTGISLVFPEDIILLLNQHCSYKVTAGQSSFSIFEQAITEALEIHTPEFVFIAQDVDADFVRELGAFSERLFEDHKPVLFLTETNLDETLDYNEAIAVKQEEFSNIDARFVSVICMPKSTVSVSGLCAGHITKANVNQSIGATNSFSITQYQFLDNWSNVNSRALDESRFITLRSYAGLKNLFWSNGRTMAGDTSDYRYIEVVRTVFKAIRLARNASLPYIQAPGDGVGLQNLLTQVEHSLNSMVSTTPQELDSYTVEMPSGQDVTNNGVQLDISLFGIPVIRKISLNFMFKYNSAE